MQNLEVLDMHVAVYVSGNNLHVGFTILVVLMVFLPLCRGRLEGLLGVYCKRVIGHIAQAILPL